MNLACSRSSGGGESRNAEVVSQLIAAKRRRVWRIAIIAGAIALIAAIAGCFLMMKSQGVKMDVTKMRDQIGMNLTMMTVVEANEAFAKYLPALIERTTYWDRKFGQRRADFRGLDVEIDQVQAMHRLGATAESWRQEMEEVPAVQRAELWQKRLKALVEVEQKKWPNRKHQKLASEWMLDCWKELWFGLKLGCVWPKELYERIAELVKGNGAIAQLEIGDQLRYLFFPYRVSAFTMLRLMGITLVTCGIGYLLCWLGTKTRFGWLGYLGLLYFIYLVNIALFIIWLEVTK